MRIIQAAKKPEEVMMACKICQSVLGIRESDLKYSDMDWMFTCPVCNSKNIISVDRDELFPWRLEKVYEAKELSDNHFMRQHEV